MAYSVQSRNGQESFNKLLPPDPDPNLEPLREGLCRWGNFSFVKKIKSIGAIVFKLRAWIDIHTNSPKCITLAFLSRSEDNNWCGVCLCQPVYVCVFRVCSLATVWTMTAGTPSTWGGGPTKWKYKWTMDRSAQVSMATRWFIISGRTRCLCVVLCTLFLP